MARKGGGKWGSFRILNDGKFISVWTKGHEPAEVMVSKDEGRSWKKISEFTAEVSGFTFISEAREMFRLADDTLLWFGRYDKGSVASGDPYSKTLVRRSTDGGMSWSTPSRFYEAAFESGVTQLPSGKLLAAVRFQRHLRTDPPYNDPDDLVQIMRGGSSSPIVWNSGPFKHVFLLESDDDGETWKEDSFRQLTTAFGQCYGDPVALSDGTVVMIHDTRYGPGVPSGRAMISRDEGKTWEDEAYYMYYGKATSGYSQSVALKDGVILTIAGTTEVGWSWDTCIGRSDLTAIRWKPVKD